MQTIPKFLTKPNGDSHTVLWDSEVVGKIDFNITTLKWEYSRYSQYPAITSGNTAEECLEAAETDHAAQYAEPLVTVVAIHHATTQPTYKAQGWGTWKQHGSGNSTKVTVRDNDGEFDIWIPASFASQVSPGCHCIHRHDRVTHQDFLAWPKRPIRRSAFSAA